MNEEQLCETIDQAVADGRIELDLSWLELTNLPSAIGRLAGLRKLSLRSNWLRDLPPEFARLTNLISLDIADNLIDKDVPAPILALHQIEELHLGGSDLPDLPAEFSRLTALRKLSLEYAQVERFPAILLALPNLRDLDLQSNMLT